MKPIPFFPQERPESCVPACLRMIFAANGLTRSEDEIYSCCQTDIDGTLPSAAAQCAVSHGFEATALRLGGLADLQTRLESGGLFPILFVNLAPLVGINALHAVVLQAIDVDAKQVQVMDPAYPPSGMRIWNLDLFEHAWRMARFQTILLYAHH